MTITKADIVENIYRQAGFTKKQSAEIVDNLFKIIKETLARGEKVKISGFGNFTIRDKAARTGRNPQTGESMKISARRVLSFKPSQILKEDIISRYAHRLDKSGQEDESIPPKSMVSKALNSFCLMVKKKGVSMMTSISSIKIPNKSSFKMNEVCELTGIRPYILRFWESEFDEISPITSASGQRIYEHKDIISILNIKDLLVEQKLSIEKAKKSFIESKKSVQEKHGNTENGEQDFTLVKEKLQNIVSEIQAIEDFLNGG